MKKKRAFTLLEIMIVIFLIGLIGSILGYSMKGSMDKGRAFKTEQSILRLQDILELEIARGLLTVDQILADPETALLNSGVVKDVKSLLKDGWGGTYTFGVDDNGEIKVTSDALHNYKVKHKLISDNDKEEYEKLHTN